MFISGNLSFAGERDTGVHRGNAYVSVSRVVLGHGGCAVGREQLLVVVCDSERECLMAR
jgi:hypothetical protein